MEMVFLQAPSRQAAFKLNGTVFRPNRDGIIRVPYPTALQLLELYGNEKNQLTPLLVDDNPEPKEDPEPELKPNPEPEPDSYECPACGREFSSIRGMNTHFRIAHPEEEHD